MPLDLIFQHGEERDTSLHAQSEKETKEQSTMPREPKTKSKTSQKSKQRVTAPQLHDTAQTTAGTTSTVPETQVTNNITTINASDAASSTQQEQSGVEQSTKSNEPVVWAGVQPSWPTWPTSKPGPRSTPPIPGSRPINTFRPEQFEEVGYNQQTGEPATQSPLRSLPDERTTGPTSFDQPTAQDTVGKRIQRL